MSFPGRGSRKTQLFALAGEETSDISGYRRIGVFRVNTVDYKNPTVILEAFLETTGPSCDFRLYNETDDVVVGSDPFFTSTSLDPERKSGSFTPAAGDKEYEVYLRMRTSEAPDQVTCTSASATVSHDDY